MPKKAKPQPTIDDLRALGGGNFFKVSAQFNDAAVEDLFDSIEAEWSNSDALARDVRESRNIGALNYTYSFLCIKLKSTKPPFLPKLDLKEISYGFLLLLEVDGLIGIFKRGPSGFDEWIDSQCDPIEKRSLIRAFGDKTTYEKISLRRMTVSRSELQACSYEAADLSTTIPVLGLGRSIPRFIKLNHREVGTVSLTPATSRIQKSGGRLTIDQLANVMSQVAATLAAPVAQSFLDAFPVPESLASLPQGVEPTGLLFELPFLGDEGGDHGSHFVLRKTGQPDREYTKATKKRFENVLKLNANGGSWEFRAPVRPKGSIQKSTKALTFQLETDLHTFVVNGAGEEESLTAWIKRTKAFSINFNSPEWFYTQGQLYKRSDFQNNIQLVENALSPHAGLNGLTSEKGPWKTYDQNTTRFEPGSIFRFVEDDLCQTEPHLLCSDLNDEWADYIALSPPANGNSHLKLIHCKAGDETSGASAFQEVIGQATKNLGRVQVSPNALITKIQKLQDQGQWTANVPIVRYRGPGNPDQAAAAIIADPNSRREVILVVNMMSIARFNQERQKQALEPHFIQLIWILSAFIHSCRELGATARIICKP